MKYLFPFLILCIIFSSCEPRKTLNSNWNGTWERNEVWMENGFLEIKNVTADTFEFYLMASNGGHIGEVYGLAKVNDTIAEYKQEDEDLREPCQIRFRIIGDTIIKINQRSAWCDQGEGVTYSGTYINTKYSNNASDFDSKTTLLSLRIFNNKIQDSVFKMLVGNYYQDFLYSTQLSTKVQDIDHIGMDVTVSGVVGMNLANENIIMKDSSNNFCAAVIDGDSILYFSNMLDYRGRLPMTIDKWKRRFKGYKVGFKSVN